MTSSSDKLSVSQGCIVFPEFDLGLLPPVVYTLPGLKREIQHRATEEACQWVEDWRLLHCKTGSFDGVVEATIRNSLAAIFMQAGYVPPGDIYFQYRQEGFVERVLVEKARRFEDSGVDDKTAAKYIEMRDDSLLGDLFRDPACKVGEQIARVMGQEKNPSSRETFGEDGAILSTLGTRMDPIADTLFWAKLHNVKSFIEKLDAELSRGPEEPPGLFNCLHDVPRPRQMLLRKVADGTVPGGFGNQHTGSLRLYAYFQKILGDRVDFSPLYPWFQLIQNAQDVYLGKDFAVVQVLPNELTVTDDGFRMTCGGCDCEYKWDQIFSAQQE